MDDLLIKYLLDEAAPPERVRVEQWLLAEEGHRKRYEQFRTAWEISGRRALLPAPSTTQALQRLKQRLQAAETTPVKRPAVYSLFRMGRVAAILAGVICIGGIYLLLNKYREPALKGNKNERISKNQPAGPAKTPAIATDGWQTIQAGNTALTNTLPDGSTVTLYKHASVDYKTGITRGDRVLRLQGGAFFSVMHNTARPFTVYVNGITVKVLGTAFDIRTIPGGTHISVKSGAVLVSSGADSLILKAGEEIVAPVTKKIAAVQVVEPSQQGGKKKPAPGADSSVKKDKAAMLHIIDDLVKEKIIIHKDSLSWFALDSRHFVVDGKKMPDTLRVLFRRRYARPDGLGYYYGPNQVRGSGICMDKKDLY